MEHLNLTIPNHPLALRAVAQILMEKAGDPEQPAFVFPPPPADDDTPAPPATDDAPAPPATIDLDASGLPWDGRIHSASKVKNKTDGLWRAKRGVDETVVKQVEAELRRALDGRPAPAPPAEEDDDAPAPPPVEEEANMGTLMTLATTYGYDGAKMNSFLSDEFGIPNVATLATAGQGRIPEVCARLKELEG